MKSAFYHTVLMVVLLWAAHAVAYTIYVDAANEGGTENGLSLATAWGTMSEGVADLAATNAAEPGGHTVLVKGGLYYQQVNLGAAHSGTGEGNRNIIKSEEHAFIQGTTYGFSPNSVDYLTIDGFRIYCSAHMGIYAQAADYMIVKNTVLYGYDGKKNGLQCSSCVNPIVENCTFWNSAEGIFIYTASAITVRNCIFAMCAVGIHERGAGVSLSHCLFFGNGIHWRDTHGGYRFTPDSLNEPADCSNNVVANPGYYMPSGYTFNQFYTNTICATAAEDGGFVGAYKAGEVTFFASSNRTFYVKDVGGDNARTVLEAQNPATPWQTIAKGAANAVAGDTVIIQAGTYATGSSIPINKGGTYDSVLQAILPVTYRAEVTGVATVESTAQSAIQVDRAGNVVLDGLVVDIVGAQPTYDYGVRLNGSGECTLNNLTITNLNGTKGAGVYVYGGGAHTVSNATIGYNNGYGIYIRAGGCTVFDSDLHDNKYGIYKDYPSYLLVKRTRLRDNTGYAARNFNGYIYGGGNYTSYENCAVYGNGSGIEIEQISAAYGNRGASIYNCVIYNNANYGVRNMSAGAKSYVYNTIVACNPKYGVREDHVDSDAYIRYSCLWGNQTNFYNEASTVLNTATQINSDALCYDNIVLDPMFYSAAGSDFRVLHDSPCIDAGLTMASIDNDLYGNVRPRMKAFDIGVHEAGQAGTLFLTQ